MGCFISSDNRVKSLPPLLRVSSLVKGFQCTSIVYVSTLVLGESDHGYWPRGPRKCIDGAPSVSLVSVVVSFLSWSLCREFVPRQSAKRPGS